MLERFQMKVLLFIHVVDAEWRDELAFPLMRSVAQQDATGCRVHAAGEFSSSSDGPPFLSLQPFSPLIWWTLISS